jgi:hypothetical protein
MGVTETIVMVAATAGLAQAAKLTYKAAQVLVTEIVQVTDSRVAAALVSLEAQEGSTVVLPLVTIVLHTEPAQQVVEQMTAARELQVCLAAV